MNKMRLLPMVILATGGLLFLKVVGFASGDVAAPNPRVARAEGLPPIPGFDISRDDAEIVTGAVNAPPRAPAPSDPAPAAAPQPGGPGPQSSVSPAERAILERLQDRRRELDVRARELEMRENLLRAAERRLQQRADELKDLEGRIAALEQRRDEQETQRFRGVVSMYETMRARDAARIFDTLELNVLIDVARAMRPPKLADIMAAMQPEPAKRLTVELARRPGQAPSDPRQSPIDSLPKIEGRPTR